MGRCRSSSSPISPLSSSVVCHSTLQLPWAESGAFGIAAIAQIIASIQQHANSSYNGHGHSVRRNHCPSLVRQDNQRQQFLAPSSASAHPKLEVSYKPAQRALLAVILYSTAGPINHGLEETIFYYHLFSLIISFTRLLASTFAGLFPNYT